MVSLVEVTQQSSKQEYALREIFVNPSHVVYLREDVNMKRRLNEGQLPEDLDLRQSFTKIQLHNGTTGTEFVVVGSPHLIEAKLKGEKKEMLYG